MIGFSAMPSQASGSSGGTINIGFVCACTGPEASSIGPSAAAYQAWASYVNAHGGVEGKQVHVIVRDDGDNTGTSLADVEGLVSSDHVVAIADNTNVDGAWASYVQSHGVPVIGPVTSSSLMYTNPDFFPEGQTQPSVNTAEAYAAKKMGGKKLALLYCAEAAVCAQGVAPLRTDAQKLGLQFVYNTAITFDAPNYTAQCLAARAAGADVLWIAQSVNATLTAGSNCAAQGYTPIELDDDAGITYAVLNNPAFNNHVISVQPDMPFSVTSTPGMKQMYAAMKKYDPSALNPANLGDEIQQAWASGALFQAAAKGGGGTTSADLINGLYSLHGATLGGLTPPLTYHRGQGHPINCWFYLRVQNGKFTTPYGLTPVCHQPLA